MKRSIRVCGVDNRGASAIEVTLLLALICVPVLATAGQAGATASNALCVAGGAMESTMADIELLNGGKPGEEEKKPPCFRAEEDDEARRP